MQSGKQGQRKQKHIQMNLPATIIFMVCGREIFADSPNRMADYKQNIRCCNFAVYDDRAGFLEIGPRDSEQIVAAFIIGSETMLPGEKRSGISKIPDSFIICRILGNPKTHGMRRAEEIHCGREEQSCRGRALRCCQTVLCGINYRHPPTLNWS